MQTKRLDLCEHGHHDQRLVRDIHEYRQEKEQELINADWDNDEIAVDILREQIDNLDDRIEHGDEWYVYF